MINRVNLMMGNKCNFHCRHCIQNDSVKDQSLTLPNNEVIKYIKRLANIRPKNKGKLDVHFWGGEPLMYMEVIQCVVEKVNNAEYTIVTNGLLLDAPIVNYCNEHDITVVLSNDGIHTSKVRGKNMLENKRFIQLFKHLKNKAVDSCITSYNQDYYALWNYIEAKLGKDIPIFHEMLECTWDMPKDLYEFNLENYKKTMDMIVDNAYKKLIHGEIGREYMLISDTANRMCKIVDNKQVEEYKCSQMRNMVSIDLKGNVYACHNACNVLGTVKDDWEVLKERYSKYLQDKTLDDCKYCEWRSVCGNGCPNSYNIFPGKAMSCEVKKIFMSACMSFLKKLQDSLEDVDMEDSYDCN